jgi:hypothetical protein
LLGVGVPTPEEAGKEIGSEAGGPTPDLGAEAPPPAEGETPPPPEGETPPTPEGETSPPATDEIPDAEENDLKKYNLEIINYGIEQDHEDRDDSTMS